MQPLHPPPGFCPGDRLACVPHAGYDYHVRRLTAYLLCVCFGLMGSGALKHLHNLAHAQGAGASLALSRDFAPPESDAPGAPKSDH